MEENCRVKISNLPPYTNFQNVKKFIKSHLSSELSFHKLKHTGTIAFFSLNNGIEAVKAVELLNNVKFKKNMLKAKRVENEPIPSNIQENNKSEIIEERKNASELVTPLAELPYNEQLKWKYAESLRLFNLLRKQMFQVNAIEVPKDAVLRKVIPAPVIKGYRNKCEFSIGYSGIEEEKQQKTSTKNIIVGFTSGKMSNKRLSVVPVDDCPNLSKNTLAIVNQFQQFVRQFDQIPFDEFKRIGFWKMLTVKDFLGESMIIVTVHPHPNREVIIKIKRALVDTFLPSKIIAEITFNFNVTSIYWQELANVSDQKIYEHLAGAPFVYESLLGVRYRISPSTFFQTNTRTAVILYTQIGDLLGLPNSTEKKQIGVGGIADDSTVELLTEISELSAEKKPRLDFEDKNEQQIGNDKPNSSTIILDICCGAGSIGLCLMNRVRKAVQSGVLPTTHNFGCVGVELNVDAIKDAKRNAAGNGFDTESCVFIDGQAEEIFAELKFHMPNRCSLVTSQIYGIVDPPRAGLSDKVIIGCRKLAQLKTLIYVSCDPKLVMKNLVDLCRPNSRKFVGEPFKIVAVQPVDMFPLTEHFEWLIKLEKC